MKKMRSTKKSILCLMILLLISVTSILFFSSFAIADPSDKGFVWGTIDENDVFHKKRLDYAYDLKDDPIKLRAVTADGKIHRSESYPAIAGWLQNQNNVKHDYVATRKLNVPEAGRYAVFLRLNRSTKKEDNEEFHIQMRDINNMDTILKGPDINLSFEAERDMVYYAGQFDFNAGESPKIEFRHHSMRINEDQDLIINEILLGKIEENQTYYHGNWWSLVDLIDNDYKIEPYGKINYINNLNTQKTYDNYHGTDIRVHLNDPRSLFIPIDPNLIMIDLAYSGRFLVIPRYIDSNKQATSLGAAWQPHPNGINSMIWAIINGDDFVYSFESDRFSGYGSFPWDWAGNSGAKNMGVNQRKGREVGFLYTQINPDYYFGGDPAGSNYFLHRTNLYKEIWEREALTEEEYENHLRQECLNDIRKKREEQNQ